MTVVLEPADVASSLGRELPIRAHLINPNLGHNCYIGTRGDPLAIGLLAARFGGGAELSADSEGVHREAIRLSREGFNVPAPTGCALELFGFIPIGIDNLIAKWADLPASAGNTSVDLELTSEWTARDRVYP